MTGSGEPGTTTRRAFLAQAALGAAALALPDAAQAAGPSPTRRRHKRPTVAVFGGGIAGLTAAHELIERGFDVTVYEERAWGGKARSTEVPGSGTNGRRDLPGEHAYRAEFGCYQNVPDLMRRIPFGANANGVFDNMVPSPGLLMSRTDKRDLALPLLSLNPLIYTPEQILDTVVGLAIEMQVPPAAAAYLGRRLGVFMASCDARRNDDWDRTTWREFIGGGDFGSDYETMFERLWEFVQASRGAETCARYPATVFETWMLQPLLGRGTNGAVMRMLDAPTDEAWIDPWVAELKRLGVRLRPRHAVLGLHMRDGAVSGARLRTPSGRSEIRADHYVCALPVERARRLFGAEHLAAAPRLNDLNQLSVGWMNGISYFVRERLEIAPGYIIAVDSPWAASFVTQAQFWAADFSSTYGDGTVHDKVSAVIANWDAPSPISGKPARDMSPDHVALDLWEQLKRHVNNPGRAPLLSDAMLHSWQIDPGMHVRKGRLVSGDPLVLPTAGTGKFRPPPATAIHNLTLSGDYLDGSWEVANMEAACFNGRRAASVVVEMHRPQETAVPALLPFRPPEWEPMKAEDERRYARGERNIFDVD
jgi:uncharacterized protein with NAD-binding domain and iron-sulfur cluster